MEIEVERQPQQTGPGLYGSDREVFQRVWRRVVETGGGEGPVEALPPAGEAPEGPQGAVLPPPLPVPAPRPAPRETRGTCLGPASARYGPELQHFLREEARDAAVYAALARRSQGPAAARLAALSAQERRHARRLSTAYFLISGVRYLPGGGPLPRWEGSLLGALRGRYLAEQEGEAAYRAAAADCQDPCLRELYLELAEEERGHARALRALLEAL